MATDDRYNTHGQASPKPPSYTFIEPPSSDLGWEEQMQVFAAVLQNLEHNFTLLAQAFASEQRLVSECRERLQSLRLRYLAWLCDFDFASSQGLSEKRMRFVKMSMDSLSESCVSLISISKRLITTMSAVESDAMYRDGSFRDDLEDIDSAVANLQDVTSRHRVYYAFSDGDAKLDHFKGQVAKLKSEFGLQEKDDLLEPRSTHPTHRPNVTLSARDLSLKYVDLLCEYLPRTMARSMRLSDRDTSLLMNGGTAIGVLAFSYLVQGLAKHTARPTYLAIRDGPPESPPEHPWVQIPVLGGILFLGSQQMNQRLGRLVPSGCAEFLPTVSFHVVAGNEIAKREVGFKMYNITHGIETTDLAGWLTRWLASQDIDRHRTCITWRLNQLPANTSTGGHLRHDSNLWLYGLVFMSLGLRTLFKWTPLISPSITSVLADDAWGVASLVAMFITIALRSYILEANRSAIDITVAHIFSKDWTDQPPSVKSLVLLPNNRAVVMIFPSDLVKLFTVDPKPQNPIRYRWARYLGYVGFVLQFSSLSAAGLSLQIVSLVVLICGTAAIYWKLGCDDSALRKMHAEGFLPILAQMTASPVTTSSHGDGSFTCRIGSLLEARLTQWSLEDLGSNASREARRQDVYAWLDLSASEEDFMRQWNLFPQGENRERWYADYKKKKAQRQNTLNGSSLTSSLRAPTEKRPWSTGNESESLLSKEAIRDKIPSVLLRKDTRPHQDERARSPSVISPVQDEPTKIQSVVVSEPSSPIRDVRERSPRIEARRVLSDPQVGISDYESWWHRAIEVLPEMAKAPIVRQATRTSGKWMG